MISALSNKITGKLIEKGIITNDEYELYTYAFFMIVSYLTFFAISLIIGILFRIILETVIFFVSFSLIRNYAGGIHADSEKKCFVLSAISLFICILTIYTMKRYELTHISIVVSICSTFILLFVYPVDSENKKLSKFEKNKLHKKVVVLTLIIFVLFVIMLVFHVANIAYSLSVSMAFANVLLLSGQIKNALKNCRKSAQ